MSNVEYTQNDEKLLTITTAMVLRPVDVPSTTPRTFLAQEQYCYEETIVKKSGCGTCPGKRNRTKLFYAVCITTDDVKATYHLPEESVVVMDEIIPEGEFGQDADARRREFGNTLPNGERVNDYSAYNQKDDPALIRKRANIVLM